MRERSNKLHDRSPDFAALNPGYEKQLLLEFDPLVGALEIDVQRLAQAV